MIYQSLVIVLLSFSLLLLLVLTSRTLQGTAVKEKPGETDESLDDFRLLSVSIIAVMGTRNYREMLRFFNERLETRNALIVLLDGYQLLDIQFSSQDPDASFGIPELEVREGGFADRLHSLFERIRNKSTIIDSGECSSFLGGITDENSLTIGFIHNGAVYAVVQFIGRNKPFTTKDIAFIDSLYDSLHALTRDHIMNYMQAERRRELEIARRMIEERYRAIFDDSMDMIYHADAEGRIVAINNSGVKILGYEDEKDLIGVYFSDLYYDASVWEFNAEILRSNSYIQDLEIVLRRKDGEKIFCLESASAAFDGAGELKGYSGIIKDISARIELNTPD